MARKSQLTDTQWHEIEKRLLAGEPARALGREFDISEAAIRKRKGAQIKQIRHVANQMVTAECALKALPIGAQISAHSLMDELRAVSTHLAGAAKYGAINAHRLNGIANQQIEKIDDTDLTPDSASMEAIKSVAILTEVANKAAQTGINLLNANKDVIKRDADYSAGVSERDWFNKNSGKVVGVSG